MKLDGLMSMRGRFVIDHYRDNKLIDRTVIHNTVTNTGKDSAAGLLGGLKSTGFTYIGIGTSATAAAAADTDLKAGITAGSLARAAATTTQNTTDVTNDTLDLVHTFSATATYTIKEAGIFDTASSGVMLARGSFADKALDDGDTLTVYYKIDID